MSDETETVATDTDTEPAAEPETGTDGDPATEPPVDAGEQTSQPEPEPVDSEWKKRARQWERAAKDNTAAAAKLETRLADTTAELDTLKAETAVKLVNARFEIAAAGTSVNVEALLDGIDPAKFLDRRGNPDVDRIVEFVRNVTPPPDPAPAGGDFGQQTAGILTPSKPASADPLVRALSKAVGADR